MLVNIGSSRRKSKQFFVWYFLETVLQLQLSAAHPAEHHMECMTYQETRNSAYKV